MLSDANGNPVDFEITGGEVHDNKVAEELINMVEDKSFFIADKGYDSDKTRTVAREKGLVRSIPRKRNSKKPNPEFDLNLYRNRHLVENLFARLKHFRSISTRFEKTKRSFKAMLRLACGLIWIKIAGNA